MGQTNRKYPVIELALSLEDCVAHTGGTHERKLAGDIIVARWPRDVIGRKEAKGFLWLRVEGVEENFLGQLTDFVPSVDPDGIIGPAYDKRRYCIPLDRLKKIVPSFDVDAALDLTRIYQPFLTVDGTDDDYRFLTHDRPRRIEGLVFDKVTGRYL